MAAPGTVASWYEPARRLVAVLQEIGLAVRDGYGEPVTWTAPGHPPQTWSDVDAVHQMMNVVRTADTGARGLVHGRLPTAASALVDLLWRAGADGRVLDCTARFNPRGGARSLARHEPEWLVALLGFAVDVVDGDAGRIATSSWLAEDERRMADGAPPQGMVPFWLGELSYLPGTVDPARLPGSLVTHPWPTRRSVGTVVALADLTATVTAPARAVDDMLLLRPYLSGA